VNSLEVTNATALKASLAVWQLDARWYTGCDWSITHRGAHRLLLNSIGDNATALKSTLAVTGSSTLAGTLGVTGDHSQGALGSSKRRSSHSGSPTPLRSEHPQHGAARHLQAHWVWAVPTHRGAHGLFQSDVRVPGCLLPLRSSTLGVTGNSTLACSGRDWRHHGAANALNSLESCATALKSTLTVTSNRRSLVILGVTGAITGAAEATLNSFRVAPPLSRYLAVTDNSTLAGTPRRD
jgi:hypothetical protein